MSSIDRESEKIYGLLDPDIRDQHGELYLVMNVPMKKRFLN